MARAFEEADAAFARGEVPVGACVVRGDEIISSDATLKLRNAAQNKEGKVSIYELPLDMAHMLRGLSNRQEIFGQIF